jgi:alkylation response protein AidB-like acyl-CoA dehydrogenase
VVLQCAESVGVAARALAMTVEHVRLRHQFGRPVGSFQAIKHRVADMHIELEGARVATRDAAEAIDRERSDADLAVHAAKSWTGRATSMITSEAVQLHGGIGFTWEHDLHLLQRRAKVNELVHGSPGWHELQLVELLRLRETT